MANPEYRTTHPKSRKQWRAWLEKNHLSSPGVWLVYYKKESGKPRVLYDEAVEEALCFGWIDSLPRKLDEEKSMLRFTPRKSRSVWSKLNKSRVEKLIAEKKMMPAGWEAIQTAKKNGSWESLSASDHAADNNLVPADLEKAFSRNNKARENFMHFSVSVRKQFLAWIDQAKRQGTREERIRQTLRMAAAGKKPGPKGFVI